MADNKPTIHHLNAKLTIPAHHLAPRGTLRRLRPRLHTRNPSSHPTAPFRSPPSLLATGPYGKAPVLVTGAADGSRYIPESLAIANYIIRTFDHSDKFGLKNGDWIRDDMLTSMCMSNLGRATGFKLYLDFGFIKNGSPAVADGPELRLLLKGLQRELVEGPEGGFFMGKEPGRADVMIEFPMSFIKFQRWVDLEGEFPQLDQWLQRVYERPAWKKGLGKGFDGVYDLSVFPRRGDCEVWSTEEY